MKLMIEHLSVSAYFHEKKRTPVTIMIRISTATITLADTPPFSAAVNDSRRSHWGPVKPFWHLDIDAII